MLVTFVLPHFAAKFANQKRTIYQAVTPFAEQSANQCESDAGHVTHPFSTCQETKIKAIDFLFQGFGQILGIDFFGDTRIGMAKQPTYY